MTGNERNFQYDYFKKNGNDILSDSVNASNIIKLNFFLFNLGNYLFHIA